MLIDRSRFVRESLLDGQLDLLDAGRAAGVGDPQVAQRVCRGAGEDSNAVRSTIYECNEYNLPLFHNFLKLNPNF